MTDERDGITTRISVNEMTTYRWTFEEDVQNYSAAGFSALSVWRQKLSDFGEEKGAELLQEKRISVSSLLWGGGFTGSDGRSFRESIDDALDGIRLASTLEAPTFVLYSGSRAGHTHSHARRLLRSAIQELLPVAQQWGVVLALEPMHESCASGWTFLNDLTECAAFIREFDSPHFRLVFDSYHFGHDPGIIPQLESILPLVAIVHLGDGKTPPHGEQNRCRLGHGTIPLGAIVNTLYRGGFEGFFDVELIGEEIEAADYVEVLNHTKSVSQRLLAEAAALAASGS